MKRLPALRPERYRVIAPSSRLTGARGHAWEQFALPALARGSDLILSPANVAPLASRGVVMIYDVAPFLGDWYASGYARWHRWLLPRVARRARLVLTASELVRGQLAEHLGVDRARTAVVPLGVDERFGAASAPAPERPYVLAVGTDLPRKNFELLDRIAPALAREGLEVLHAGSTRPYMAPGEHGLRSLGYVPDADLPALYAGAAVLAMPSLYEGFGLPCLEAMAAGTPVVAADRGALPETCGDAALIADPGDEDGFANAIVRAAAPGAEREELIAKGRARAAGFTWTRTAEQVDGALEELLERHGRQ